MSVGYMRASQAERPSPTAPGDAALRSRLDSLMPGDMLETSGLEWLGEDLGGVLASVREISERGASLRVEAGHGLFGALAEMDLRERAP